MKINKMIGLSLLTMLVLTGCNDDDNNNLVEDTIVTTTTSGTVIDGYIQGSTVCLDLNLNNLCEFDEPQTTTDSNGKYSLKIVNIPQSELDNAQIIAIGGTDTFTNKPFDSILKSNYIPNTNEMHLNSITTLLAESSSNSEYKSKLKTMARNLNISESDINSDVLKLEDKAAFKETLKIQKALEAMKNNDNVNMEEVRKTIANNILLKNMDLNTAIDNSLSSEYIVVKEQAKYIIKEIDKNKSNIIEDNINLQNKIERITETIANEVIIEGTVGLYQENIEFLNTLDNVNVNNFLKDIHYRINLDDVLFPDDREFLEKLNNMTLSDNPTVEEVQAELSNVGVTEHNTNFILKLMTIAALNDINE
jgi:hypothetical protein